jgi:2'-5' RNA ligase
VRLFVAINLPDDVRRGVWEATASLRASDMPIRWARPEGLHVTLKFLGEVEADREPAVCDALESTVRGTRAFDVVLDGCGVFPSSARPRVVWAGAEPSPPLELVQDGIERSMAALGFEVEGRVFRPHVTLGRVRRNPSRRALEGLDALVAEAAVSDGFQVTSVDLMRSTLGREGAVYDVRHSVMLEEA